MNEAMARYEPIKQLGTGTFGQVWLAQERTRQRHVAIKYIERGDKVTKYVKREVANHRLLLHAHVVQLLEVFLTPTHLAIVMEYCPGGDLFDFVVRNKGLQEHEARWFFQQLICSVDYLHRCGIMSRDIKLENTLLDGSARPLIKLCDFGYSKHEQFHSAPGSRVGTPAYLAPEIVTATGGIKYDGKMSDVWSAGVMLYVMLAGSYPFERIEDRQHPTNKLQLMIQRIINVDYKMPTHISEEGKDLLSKILVADPSKRLTIEQIQNHPWYLTDLPPGVKEMNDTLHPPQCMQSQAEVDRILDEAALVPGEPPSHFWDSEDASFDEAITGFLSHEQAQLQQTMYGYGQVPQSHGHGQVPMQVPVQAQGQVQVPTYMQQHAVAQRGPAAQPSPRRAPQGPPEVPTGYNQRQQQWYYQQHMYQR